MPVNTKANVKVKLWILVQIWYSLGSWKFVCPPLREELPIIGIRFSEGDIKHKRSFKAATKAFSYENVLKKNPPLFFK